MPAAVPFHDLLYQLSYAIFLVTITRHPASLLKRVESGGLLMSSKLWFQPSDESAKLMNELLWSLPFDHSFPFYYIILRHYLRREGSEIDSKQFNQVRNIASGYQKVLFNKRFISLATMFLSFGEWLFEL